MIKSLQFFLCRPLDRAEQSQWERQRAVLTGARHATVSLLAHGLFLPPPPHPGAARSDARNCTHCTALVVQRGWSWNGILGCSWKIRPPHWGSPSRSYFRSGVVAPCPGAAGQAAVRHVCSPTHWHGARAPWAAPAPTFAGA